MYNYQYQELKEGQRRARESAREDANRIVAAQQQLIHQTRLLHDPAYQAKDLIKRRKLEKERKEASERQARQDREDAMTRIREQERPSEATLWANEHPWLMRVCDVAVTSGVVCAEVAAVKFWAITLPMAVCFAGAPFTIPAGLGLGYCIWRGNIRP